MRRTTTLLFPLMATAIALVALLPAVADAAKSGKRAKAVKPKITLVAPMRVGIGQKLVIRGRDFRAGAKRNTVVFRAGNGRVAFAKPIRVAKRKLVVRVPSSVARLLKAGKSSGQRRPTRLKLRVISARRYSAFTSRRLSPVIVGPDEVAKACGGGNDQDGDLLSNGDELRFKTNPCMADTDGDGLSDGWEYYSAKDLNLKAVPYPGKRPYPNPLDPTDAGVDFDGDFLPAAVEYRLWRYTGSSFEPGRAGNHTPGSPLGYSDGTQASRPDEAPAAPSFRTPSYGYPFAPPAYPARDAMPHAGAYHAATWTDDERDADVDGLNNYVETSGPGRFGWWDEYLDKLGIEPWPESYYGSFEQRPFADLDPADPDVDGDTLLDGEDDQDNDDVLNFDEMYDVDVPFGPDAGAKNAFNPCAPDRGSRTCPIYVPF